MNMNNDDTDQTIALGALGWEPLKVERIKTKAKLMFKLLNTMGPKSLADFLINKLKWSDNKLWTPRHIKFPLFAATPHK